ncbi:MAG: hypothetical protein N3E50_08340 [Candidatus Goldbacteria bacterium]|nr:hypothetical protein [Candidatus Goldiibacteriota bacterium]
MKIKNKKAQAMTEYVLIILLIAVFCILAANFFQLCMKNAFENFIFALSIPIP